MKIWYNAGELYTVPVEFVEAETVGEGVDKIVEMFIDEDETIFNEEIYLVWISELTRQRHTTKVVVNYQEYEKVEDDSCDEGWYADPTGDVVKELPAGGEWIHNAYNGDEEYRTDTHVYTKRYHSLNMEVKK